MECLSDVIALAEPVKFVGLALGFAGDVKFGGGVLAVHLVALADELHLLLGEALLVNLGLLGFLWLRLGRCVLGDICELECGFHCWNN